MGVKCQKCWPQTSAGDYKGAQPPYRGDKRAERALSARYLQYLLSTQFNGLRF